MKHYEMGSVSEMDIIDEAPRKVLVGSRYVLIRQLTLNEIFWISKQVTRMALKYSQPFARLLVLFEMVKNEEGNWREQLQSELAINIQASAFRRDLAKILNHIYPSVGRRWFFRPSYLEKHLTPNVLIQLLSGLYFYNVAMVKKNILQAQQWVGRDLGVSLFPNSTGSSKPHSTGQPVKRSAPQSENASGILKGINDPKARMDRMEQIRQELELGAPTR